MPAFVLRRFLPRALRALLWGDRERWGLDIDTEDPCWNEWQQTYSEFYSTTQRQGIGTVVNDSGYRVMAQLDLTGKRVLEIGAGDIRHIAYWRGRPREYILADVHKKMMDKACVHLNEVGIPFRNLLLSRGEVLPLPDDSVDVVVSFYSLEHIYPLRPYLKDLRRVLRPGGALIGAIPAEGGLAWGGGRLLTSRRWFKQHTAIDPDKIICWEHPNFADEILGELSSVFEKQRVEYWPLPFLPMLDLNLVVRILYRKEGK